MNTEQKDWFSKPGIVWKTLCNMAIFNYQKYGEFPDNQKEDDLLWAMKLKRVKMIFK